MATLNTLRTRGAWIVSIVIGMALFAFIIGDLVGKETAFGVKEKVGTINGEKITYLEYAQKVESFTEISKLTSGSESLTTEQQDQIRNYAWEMMLNDIVIFPGLKELGIEVTEDEMLDLIYGNNISPVLTGMGVFTDPQTGMYDKQALQEFVSALDRDYTGNSRRLWQYIQDQVYQEAMMSKYFTLVNKMAYVSDAEATVSATRTNTVYNARYVAQTYDQIPDSTVKVSSSEIRKYYDAHKENYKQGASRQIEYVVFDVLPSVRDYADAKAFVNQLAEEFAESNDVQQYVTLNSHEPFNPSYYTKEQLPEDLREYAFNSNRTAIYGPMLENDTYTVTRISDMRSFSDTVAIRQMAFMPGQEKLADSVFTELKKGTNFNALADLSAIPLESADMGRMSTQFIPMELGEPIYSTRDRYVKYTAPNGATFIFDVYYRGPESQKVQLANVIYHVEPSAATQQAAYAKASGFYTATAGLKNNFDKIVADSVYSKRTARVYAGQTQISGLDNAREMIRWAFNGKVGGVSSIMEVDNNYVVAVLASATEDGYMPVDEAALSIASALRQEKKAGMLADKMKGTTSLNALAQNLSANVVDVEALNYNTFYIPEAGVEPALIGAICGGVVEGNLSKPVKGLGGVYVVEITSKEESAETDLEMERARLNAQHEYNLAQRAMGALIQKSNVVDNRSRYF